MFFGIRIIASSNVEFPSLFSAGINIRAGNQSISLPQISKSDASRCEETDEQCIGSNLELQLEQHPTLPISK